MGSDQVATVLRQSGAQVRLVVARPTDEPSQSQQRRDNPAIILTATLEDYLDNLNAQQLDDSTEVCTLFLCLSILSS